MGADEEGDEHEDDEDDLESLFKPCPGRLPSLPAQGPTKVDIAQLVRARARLEVGVRLTLTLTLT